MTETETYDVIIAGGSYAGLSAAMSLGRSLRKVIVIDSGDPCNLQTPHSHNFLTQDGSRPADIAAIAKEQVSRYTTVKFCSDTAIRGYKDGTAFIIETVGVRRFAAGKLLFATGIRDIYPDIPGFKECWGISVIHCPYCHGYEYRGKHTAIMANGERAFHLVSLVYHLTKKITVFTSGEPLFTDVQLEKLTEHDVRVITTPVTEILHNNGYVNGLVLQDGEKHNVETAYAAVPFEQKCAIPAALGCAFTEQGYIQTDSFQQTSVAGVYAAGDNTTMMRSVASSVAAGSFAGAAINRELAAAAF
ncbi:NAD(P)/FAD-dependent oxidoreductase [Sediminibacterium ginsengisoli]|uniref:Thioredoxin reductase n=1 Tax=Sediminibacterium ginsengisoli TaxID=413434 RepID=A0A1T4PQ77_9BACT|nr:NAD(P)/FAD-dependent oxidoreductase [Sediminibacterium ginsengisoli]SJZ93683.1 Thioredoxin reductase [Sediminibacterium ginsengisoli]